MSRAPLAPNLDLCLMGTLNQDFDVITGADTMEGAIDVVVDEASPEERSNLRNEIADFLQLSDEEIQAEFAERWTEISPDYAKDFLVYFLESINRYGDL
ncbi:contact-dependent growth inhibition system immunity protein [Pseudescherichia sp.]|uniref:contact-dependent growth inhibition system immunity protein n=1 Tax=Pseudescherichia sp. TaxID=2055881 RepID=UPI0028A02926|nr:contact-dependent growth inhibition system immunity protein [Pseudescherichia sp.]